MRKGMLFGCWLLVVSCGPQGRLAAPEQNVAERFEVTEGLRQSWSWTVAGGPAVLSLSTDGPHEMVWTVSDKSMSRVRRSRISSLQVAPRFFAQGPKGVREVRFSPSGKTILAHEFAEDSSRFQTVVFLYDEVTGAWRSRTIPLGEGEKTRLRKLDDGSRVPSLLSPATPPTILRLDEGLVIYEVNGERGSYPLR